jgi:glucuronosyltransferase
MSPAWLLMLTMIPLTMIRCAKVLGVFPFPARSHLIVQKALMFELARRGHEVTVFSAFPESKVIPNYTDIELKTSIKGLMGSVGKGAAGVYIYPSWRNTL